VFLKESCHDQEDVSKTVGERAHEDQDIRSIRNLRVDSRHERVTLITPTQPPELFSVPSGMLSSWFVPLSGIVPTSLAPRAGAVTESGQAISSSSNKLMV
jgi:hypothetical protein